ncbi:DNA methyltransferase [uncultured Nocardioides sp.]|uniref:DNA methyltransferase n=1 Tax=uncultured Nocardioides sp. TaxID=198441 RepID=UPI0032B1E621
MSREVWSAGEHPCPYDDWSRAAAAESDEFRVVRANTRTVTATDSSGEERKLPANDVVVLKKFGEPAYPALKPQGRIARSETKPYHSVINGENFHALQLLRYLYRGQVDCIYIDPPYNTGDRDWQYNNRYIDEKDRWRHSKWLSFMEKRLVLAKDLLREDGVLIVTIDEHEVHHLGVLLEQVFPGRLLQTITIVMNPKGTGKINFARVNEYALFCLPKTTESVVTGLPEQEADMLTGKRHVEHVDQQDEDDEAEAADEGVVTDEEEVTAEEIADEAPLPFPREDLHLWELRHARRRGGESSYRHQRPNQFYPLYVDPEAGRVVGTGEALPLDREPSFEPVDGLVPLWPIDKEGNQRCWRYIPESMQKKIDGGFVVLGQASADGKSWTVNYWVPKTQRKKYKTVWWSTSHDAGTHGTSMLHKLLGDRTAFPFPKSLYAVRDTLLTVVRDRPNALILDFFAGSGTTLHATALINALDGGSRRCILVSNNEVAAKTSDRLLRAGHLPGDEEYEKHGIFWKATRPRVEAAITGRRDGKPIDGAYQGIDRSFADGFEENVEFYDLVYLDRDSVRDGAEFAAVEPSLWLAAGGVGSRPSSSDRTFRLPRGQQLRRALRPQGLPPVPHPAEGQPAGDAPLSGHRLRIELQPDASQAPRRPDHLDALPRLPGQLPDQHPGGVPMRFTLLPFQETTVGELVSEIRYSMDEVERGGRDQAVVLVAPTGAGKTVMAAAALENLLFGDGQSVGEDDELTVVWLSDLPNVNEQTMQKIETASERFTGRLIRIDNDFRGDELAAGNVYFLNTQKLGANTNLVSPGDDRDASIWEILTRTIRRNPAKFLLIIDEAHRGMERSNGASDEAATIVQRFVLGFSEMPQVPIVVGISATPERFDAVLASTNRTRRQATSPVAAVRASGLLKDRIVVWRPEHGLEHSDMTLLQRAAQTLLDYQVRWSRHTAQHGTRPVRPVMVVQVEDKTATSISATDLEQAIEAIEEVTGPLSPDAYAHSFGDAPAAINLTSRRLRYLRPADIDADPEVTIVFFKTSLSTGWDCPRAEVIMSFRGAQDDTLIAQLVGRLVRTPLARRIESDDALNGVALYLPKPRSTDESGRVSVP